MAHAGLDLERELWQTGYRAIAGADEAGRGAWAGPLFAAAVILPPEEGALTPLLGRVDDSKRLTPRERGRLFTLIHGHALAIGVSSVSAAEIDRVGVGLANQRALAEALAALAIRPDFVLLDFFTVPALAWPQRGVPHGDALSLSIAAASIVAKVTRDRWITMQDVVYPGYGFARHKGYGTAMHRTALVRLGPCALHRLSYAPVAKAATAISLGEHEEPGNDRSAPCGHGCQ